MEMPGKAWWISFQCLGTFQRNQVTRFDQHLKRENAKERKAQETMFYICFVLDQRFVSSRFTRMQSMDSAFGPKVLRREFKAKCRDVDELKRKCRDLELFDCNCSGL